jgi:hypothetical protein
MSRLVLGFRGAALDFLTAAAQMFLAGHLSSHGVG